MDVRGRFIRATPELIRERFTRPECTGTGVVCYGSRALTRRCVAELFARSDSLNPFINSWPTLKKFYYRMNGYCPRCMIYRGFAEEWWNDERRILRAKLGKSKSPCLVKSSMAEVGLCSSRALDLADPGSRQLDSWQRRTPTAEIPISIPFRTA